MPSAKHSRQAETAPASYEQAVAELEQIVQAMETGQLSLDDTLAAYKRGNLLLNYCRGKLQAVEQQVQVLDSAQQLQPLPAQIEAQTDGD